MHLVGKPNIANKTLMLKRLQDVLDSGVLTNNGKYVQELEQTICEFLEVNYCVAFCNATCAFDALISLIKPKKASIQSFNFIAFPSILFNRGIKTSLVDVDDEYCMEDIEDELVVPTNLFGNNSSSHYYKGKFVCYDSAHALGVFDDYNSHYIGNNGNCEIFSLHSTKIFNSVEGGIITTNDESLAKELSEIRNFGHVQNSGLREGLIHNPGFNYKMSEIHACIGLTNLENRESIQEHYFNIHNRYKQNLGDLIKDKNCFFSNYSYVITEVDNRDKIIERLNAANIFPRSYFKPIHMMGSEKAYDYVDKNSPLRLPNTERIAEMILALPTGLTVTLEDVDYISTKLLEAINDG